MDEKNPVLLIERLSVFTAIVAAISSLRGRQVFYVHETWIADRFLLPFMHRIFGNNIKKLDNVDFLGLFYQYMEQACSYANDAILKKNNSNLYIRISLDFCGNNDYLTAIEKELLNRYTASRVKTHVIVQRMAEKYRDITLLPVDNEDIGSILFPPVSMSRLCRIPRWISVTNAVKRICLDGCGFVLFPAMLAGICIKILQKGVVVHTPEKKYYTYGIDMQKNGLVQERGLDAVTNRFFLYDDCDFAPENILHVVRNGHRLDEDARNVFLRFHCPFVELESLKVPLDYLIRRVFRGFFIGGCAKTIGYAIRSGKSYYCILPALSVMKMTMDEEINSLYNSIRVFIARDDYSPFHIIRTLVAHASGNRTIGFQWADYYFHNSSFSHFVFDRYALFGDFYREFHKKGLTHTKPEIIGAGIYGSDTVFHLKERGYYPEKYQQIRDKFKIVAIMGSAFESETSITRGPAIRFHQEVLDLTDDYPDICRVLKPKGDYLDPEIKEMMKGRTNVYLEKELSTPRFLLVPDLIIVQSNSTIGIEALMAGKKVLYYSFVTPSQYQIYAQYGMPLVAFTREELKKSLDAILKEDTYLDEAVVTEIQQKYGYRFDGKIVERFRILCRELAGSGRSNTPVT